MEGSSVIMTPARRETKGWLHRRFVEEARISIGSMLFVGASIIAHFKTSVAWEKCFMGELNIGIGGDCTQHVLWRLQHMKLPTTVKFAILHCGTNNIGRNNTPAAIAHGIKACGLQLLQMVPGIKVIIAGIIPKDLIPSDHRGIILDTNIILEELCRSMPDTTYLPQNGWIQECGVLETNYFKNDNLHLSGAGYDKFAKQIITTMESLDASDAISTSPKSSSYRSQLPLRLCGTGHRHRHRCTNRYPQSSSPSPSPPTAHRSLHRRPLRPRPTHSRSHGPQRYHYPLSSSSSS